MPYIVETVPRDRLIPGKDWALWRDPETDELRFLLANDAVMEFTCEQVDAVVAEIYRFFGATEVRKVG